METLRRGLRAWLVECFWLVTLFVRIVSSDFVVHFLQIRKSWSGVNGARLAQGEMRRIPSFEFNPVIGENGHNYRLRFGRMIAWKVRQFNRTFPSSGALDRSFLSEARGED
jgi:hypothetical protein